MVAVHLTVSVVGLVLRSGCCRRVILSVGGSLSDVTVVVNVVVGPLIMVVGGVGVVMGIGGVVVVLGLLLGLLLGLAPFGVGGGVVLVVLRRVIKLR